MYFFIYILQIGVPEWIVDLRHEAAHGDLPPLVSLRAAANWALHWLKVKFSYGYLGYMYYIYDRL